MSEQPDAPRRSGRRLLKTALLSPLGVLVLVVAYGLVLLVGVDVASSDDPQALTAFVSEAQLASLPITWTIDADGSLAAQYQDQSLDETVGVAGDVVRFRNASLVDPQQLRQQIEQLQ